MLPSIFYHSCLSTMIMVNLILIDLQNKEKQD